MTGLIGGGQLLPGIQARVIRPDGSVAAYGEEGELIVKGPAAALGYLNNQQASVTDQPHLVLLLTRTHRTNETFIDG